MGMEQLVGFCGSLQDTEIKWFSIAIKRGGQGKKATYELVIDPTNNGLNCRTQHLMQPDMPAIRFFNNHLRIHHRSPFQHLSDPPLSTNVFSQSVGIEGVRGDVRVVGTGIYVWTRVEEH